ncbi:MAG: adenosylhomocysteinase [Methanobacteriota archaeon]|nr:MAG: adenosylhomocysteinase [Euryarchaeota archaeon]
MSKDLVKKGVERLEWAKEHMKVLEKVRNELTKKKSLKGMRIGMALHVEAKTGMLALTLREAGADVRLASCNPLSTDDSVSVALNEHYELPTFAKKGETSKEYYSNLNSVLDHEPDILVDDGCDLISLVHTKRKKLLDVVKGANEETTTGIIRLKAMEQDGALKFPVISVNDAKMKYLFDNRYGTGQSTIDGVISSTNLLVAGKKVVIAGYGGCGRGIAMRIDGMGGNVTVTEVDRVRAIEARLDGFLVQPMMDAIRDADFVITATGCKDVVSERHLKIAKDGCLLANSGHFDNEVSKVALKKLSKKKRKVRDFVEEYSLKNGRKVYLLGEGRLINLVAGQGHPVEIMDMSFSIQALCARYLAENYKKLKNKVYDVPRSIDDMVAKIRLKSWGIKIDKLSPEQKDYLSGWSEGT